MLTVVIESRENYRYYIKDISDFSRVLSDYIFFSSLDEYEKYFKQAKYKPDVLVVIMSNLFLADIFMKKIQNIDALSKKIVIMDNTTFYDDSDKKNYGFVIFKSEVLDIYSSQLNDKRNDMLSMEAKRLDSV